MFPTYFTLFLNINVPGPFIVSYHSSLSDSSTTIFLWSYDFRIEFKRDVDINFSPGSSWKSSLASVAIF